MREPRVWGTMEWTSDPKEDLVSTVPGAESWRDAGLTSPEPEDVVELSPSAEEPEDYDPEPESDPTVKLVAEADLVEQLIEVPADEREEYP